MPYAIPHIAAYATVQRGRGLTASQRYTNTIGSAELHAASCLRESVNGAQSPYVDSHMALCATVLASKRSLDVARCTITVGSTERYDGRHVSERNR